MKPAVLTILVLLCASAASAQTPSVCSTSPCLVQKDKPVQIQADIPDPPADLVGIRLFINGAVAQTVQPSTIVGGVVSFTASFPRGQHTIYVESFNEAGVAASTPLTVDSQSGPPKPPTGLRIIRQ